MLKSLAIALLLASSSLQAMDSKGALACLEALPEKYRNGVLKLSADNANPDPDTWYVSAQAGPDDKGMRSIEIASGQIISDKPALGLREIFSSASNLLQSIDINIFKNQGIIPHAQERGWVLGFGAC
jgi:hypothetical protein